jgi:hypothetical protein
MLLVTLAGYVDRHQQDVIEYSNEEHLEVCLEGVYASGQFQPAEDGGVIVANGGFLFEHLD